MHHSNFDNLEVQLLYYEQGVGNVLLVFSRSFSSLYHDDRMWERGRGGGGGQVSQRL
jgi:hypothetical protein